MGPEERFDSFYLATRSALVHQTFALTGDLPAAHSAVRDAYIAAWHHWRKVSARPDPLDWVRPLAWRLAQRRHTARLWHRNRGISAEDTEILQAIAKLPMGPRRALLLTQLAGVTLPAAARELGVPQRVAERHLQTGTANLATHLDVASTSIRIRLLSLADTAAGVPLPRASIIRRTGQRRRRAHTAVAIAAATMVAIASGAFAYQPSQVQASDVHLIKPKATKRSEPQVRTMPTADDLLDEHQIARLGLDREWDVVRTHANTSGDGINTVCQQTRFADPHGVSAIVRTSRAAGGRPRRSAVQTIEISKSEPQAVKAYATTVGWYAGCRVARLQLLTAYRVDGIGDQAQALTMKVWQQPATTYSVAIARVGRVVTSTVGKSVGGSPTPPQEIAQSLADAVAMLCGRSGAEECPNAPTFTAVPPPPSGEERGILAVADLPPVGRLREPWVGTEAKPARTNPSATTCDQADFDTEGAGRTRTRTFLIPGAARLPDRFGLSETYGVFRNPRAASRFLDRIRARLATCEKRTISTDVRTPRTMSDPRTHMELSTWDLETEISEDESVRFRLGLVRVGSAVAQVNFSPTEREDVSAGDFTKLVLRAGDRLRELG